MTNDVMSNGTTEQLKKFVFSSKHNARGETREEKLEIIIPEVLKIISCLNACKRG